MLLIWLFIVVIIFHFLRKNIKIKQLFSMRVWGFLLYSLISCYDNLVSCCFTTFYNFRVLLCMIRQLGRAAHKAYYIYIGLLYFQPTKWRIKGSTNVKKWVISHEQTWNMMHLSCIWCEEEVYTKVISDITHLLPPPFLLS